MASEEKTETSTKLDPETVPAFRRFNSPNFSTGFGIVKQYETYRCQYTELDFFQSEKKEFGNGLQFRAAKTFYTDNRGIALPLADVHARLYGRPENACESVDAWDLEKAPVSVKIPGPFDRQWAYDAVVTPYARRFFWLCEKKGDYTRKHSKEELVANECAVDREKLQAAWKAIQEILDGISDCPEREIPLPEGIGYAPLPKSPEKVMGQTESFGA
jgi:hypothetical protein